MRLLTLFSPFFSQRLNVQLSNQRLAYPPVSWSRRECPLEVKSRHFSGFFRGHQRLHIKVIFHWAMHLQATRQVASSGQFISDSGAIYSCGWSNHRWLNQVAGYFFFGAPPGNNGIGGQGSRFNSDSWHKSPVRFIAPKFVHWFYNLLAFHPTNWTVTDSN